MADTSFGRLLAVLGLDTKQFERGMRDAQRLTRQVGRELEQVGRNLSLTVTAPLAAIGAASLKAASDAEQMRSRFRIVFAESARDAEQWAAATAGAVNRSQVSLQGYLSTFQAFFSASGFGTERAAELSKTLTQLSLDFASFNDISDEEAVSRFVSALSGSTEVLDRFGVNLKVAALEQEALRLGIEGSYKDLSEQQKQLLRISAVLRQTADAHGNAAQTADEFANRWKGLTEALYDARVAIGDVLLPAAGDLVAHLQAMLQWIRELEPATLRWSVVVAGLAAALGPVLVGLGILVGAIGTIGLPVAGAIVALTALIAAVGAVQFEVETFGINWDRVWTEVRTGLAEKVAQIADMLGRLVELFGKVRGILSLGVLGADTAAEGAALRAYAAEVREIVRLEQQAADARVQARDIEARNLRAKLDLLKKSAEELGDISEDSRRQVEDLIKSLAGAGAATVDGFSRPEVQSRIEMAIAQPFENATHSIERTFTDMIARLVSGTFRSFSDLAQSVRDIFARQFADVLIGGLFGGGTGGGGLGGLLGSIFGGGSTGSGIQGPVQSSLLGRILEILRGSAPEGTSIFGGALGNVLGNIGGIAGGAAAGFGLGSLFSGTTGLGAALGGVAGSIGGFLLSAIIGGAAGGPFGLLGGIIVGILGGAFEWAFGEVQRLTADRKRLDPQFFEFFDQAGIGDVFRVGSKLFGGKYWFQALDAMTKLYERFRFGEGTIPGAQIQTTATLEELAPIATRVPGLETPFGAIGIITQRFSEVFDERHQSAAASEILETIQALDQAFAEILSPDEIEKVIDALMGLSTFREITRDPRNDIGALFVERIETIIRAIGGDPAAFGLTVAQTGGFFLEPQQKALSEFLEARVQFREALDTLERTRITEFESELEHLNDMFDELAGGAAAFGISMEEVAQSLEIGTQSLREEFGRSVLEILDPLAAALENQALVAEDRLRTAEKLGFDLVEVERANAEERKRIIEDASRPIKGLLDQLTATSASPLPIGEVLANVEAEFADLLSQVQGGDITVAGELTDAATRLLDVSRRTFASSEAFFTRFYFVVESLENVLGGLPGFATGGSFTVGGHGGTDSQLVAFRATPGEQVTISGQGGSAIAGEFMREAARGNLRTQQLLEQLIVAVEGMTASQERVERELRRSGYRDVA